jgi:hypothetical protein
MEINVSTIILAVYFNEFLELNFGMWLVTVCSKLFNNGISKKIIELRTKQSI